MILLVFEISYVSPIMNVKDSSPLAALQTSGSYIFRFFDISRIETQRPASHSSRQYGALHRPSSALTSAQSIVSESEQSRTRNEADNESNLSPVLSLEPSRTDNGQSYGNANDLQSNVEGIGQEERIASRIGQAPRLSLSFLPSLLLDEALTSEPGPIEALATTSSRGLAPNPFDRRRGEGPPCSPSTISTPGARRPPNPERVRLLYPGEAHAWAPYPLYRSARLPSSRSILQLSMDDAVRSPATPPILLSTQYNRASSSPSSFSIPLMRAIEEGVETSTDQAASRGTVERRSTQ